MNEHEQQQLHRRKMIAPIVVTVLMILYYLAYFLFLISYIKGFWAVVCGIIPLLLGAGVITVCVQRIKEIQGGEEDDLSQY